MRLIATVAALVLALSAGGLASKASVGGPGLGETSEKEVTEVVLRTKLTSKPTTQKSLVGKSLSSLKSWLQYKKDFQALVAVDLELDQLAEDLLYCRGAGSEDFVFRPMLNVLEDRALTSALPTARYRLNALVMRCPEVITGNVLLGIFHFEADLLLFHPVASPQLEETCLADADRDRRADCFKRSHQPADRFSQERLAALLKYMTAVAIRDGKSFLDYFMY